MARVIKTPEENKPKVEWTKQIDCPMCHALIEYNNLDVHQMQGRYNDIEYTVDCPYCKKWFVI